MSRSLQYMPKLDGLRAIAALMVLVCHYFSDLHFKTDFAYGGNGVQIFFTISGFLITYILLKQKNKNVDVAKPKMIGLFMLKRMLRLFPIYYLVVIILYFFSKAGGLWLCEKGSEWYYFIYAQNFLFYKSGAQSPLLFHTWSLAVEEQFYLLWPFLIFFIPKRAELVLLLSVFCVGLLSKYYFYYYDNTPGTTLGITIIHFDTLGIGSLLAYCIYYNKTRVIHFLEKYAACLFLIFFSLTVIFTYFSLNVFLLALFLTGMSVFLVFMASSAKTYFIDGLLNIKALNYLGKISYGIYLYHKPVPFFFNYTVNKLNLFHIENKVLLLFIYMGITIAIAVISWNTIEKYFLRLKERLDVGNEKRN